MALKGTNTKVMDRRGQVRSIVNWSATQDRVNNTSTITVDVYIDIKYAVYATASANVVVNIDGQSQSVSRVIGNHPNGVYKRVARVTKTVDHNDDGSKSPRIRVSNPFLINYAGEYIGTANHDFTPKLDDIPRESSISNLTWFEIGVSNPSFRITSHVSSYRHRADLRMDGVTIAKMENLAAGNHTFNLTESQINSMLNRTSNTNSKAFQVVLYTYSGSTRIGSTRSASNTAEVSYDYMPEITSTNIQEANASLVSKKFDFYVNKLSRLRLRFNASPSKGSKIKEMYVLVNDGKKTDKHVGGDVITPILDVRTSTEVATDVTFVAVDTRGRQVTVKDRIFVYEYHLPIIDMDTGFHRVKPVFTEQGILSGYERDSEDGLLVTGEGNVEVASLGGYYDNNTWSYKIESMPYDGFEWSLVRESTVSGFTNTNISPGKAFIDQPFDLHKEYDKVNSYVFRVTVTDAIGQTVEMYDLPSGYAILDFHNSGRGVGIGKISELWDTLEIAYDTKMYGDLDVDGILSVGGNPVVDYIIESGENSNGSWEKWKSGKLVQWGVKTYEHPLGYPLDQFGGTFKSTENMRVSYPVRFSDIPAFNVTCDVTAGGQGWLYTRGAFGSVSASTEFVLTRPTQYSNNTVIVASWVAIGKWK